MLIHNSSTAPFQANYREKSDLAFLCFIMPPQAGDWFDLINFPIIIRMSPIHFYDIARNDPAIHL